MNSRFQATLEGLGVLVGTIWIATMMSLYIGGMGYRMDCVNQDADIEKSWSVSFASLIVPYLLRPSKEGCETHTATRVALSAVGVSSIGSDDEIAARITGGLAASGDSSTDIESYYQQLFALNAKSNRNLRELHPESPDLDALLDGINDYESDLQDLDAPDELASEHAAVAASIERVKTSVQRMIEATSSAEFEDARSNFESGYAGVEEATKTLSAKVRELTG